MQKLHGQLFKVSIARIPTDQDFGEPLSAVNGNVSGDPFCVGVIHDMSWTKSIAVHYLAFLDGRVLDADTDLGELGNQVLSHARAKLGLTDEEIEELQQIMLIQDDAEYDFTDKWEFTLGQGGEVSLSDVYAGGIIVNVTPYYDTEIKLQGKWGEANDDKCAEEHEFCGAFIV